MDLVDLMDELCFRRRRAWVWACRRRAANSRLCLVVSLGIAVLGYVFFFYLGPFGEGDHHFVGAGGAEADGAVDVELGNGGLYLIGVVEGRSDVDAGAGGYILGVFVNVLGLPTGLTSCRSAAGVAGRLQRLVSQPTLSRTQ